MDIEQKIQKEKQFIQALETIETIDELQTKALQSYDDGMTFLGSAKFSNESLNLRLNPNSFTITPAFTKIDSDFHQISSDRKQYSLTPIFSEKPSWTEISPEEYQLETKARLEEIDHKKIDVLEELDLENNPIVRNIRDKFKQSLESYLNIARIIQQIHVDNQLI